MNAPTLSPSPSNPPAIQNPTNDTFFYPTYSPSNSATSDEYEEASYENYITTVLTFATFIVIAITIGYRNWAPQSTTETQAQVQTENSNRDAATRQSEDRAAKLLRANVLDKLFPEERMDNSNLQYDLESNTSSQGFGEASHDDTCPICIAKVQDGDSVVVSPCKHGFHRHCILDWCQIRSDCPVCRQDMWDPLEYSLMEKEIVARATEAET